ncbi:uncharacterized protein EI90DRAFT_3020437 [Cantharellus anzutake]|uniref:uncharacterized protein n=1 Tax=Cantharellus anzutake TaxID=1750568 RepID=UPI0019080205|nr:uncharacterized protein EI90DRAFT_3020437 [Cantharellus anzutake]KAF8321033.1 hypothetical protein EI90DRAFT_3020437 [Cantharellus anzutake]
MIALTEGSDQRKEMDVWRSGMMSCWDKTDESSKEGKDCIMYAASGFIFAKIFQAVCRVANLNDPGYVMKFVRGGEGNGLNQDWSGRRVSCWGWVVCQSRVRAFESSESSKLGSEVVPVTQPLRQRGG